MAERNTNEKVAIFITREGMGDAPEQLSQLLVKNYLTLLLSEERIPSYICLYANGVKLACDGSSVIDELKKLEEAGAKIVLCKTCLNYFNLLDKVQTGTVGTMLDIIDIQHNSTKIINL